MNSFQSQSLISSGTMRRGHIPASVLKLLTAKTSTPSRYTVVRYTHHELQDVTRKEKTSIDPFLNFSRSSFVSLRPKKSQITEPEVVSPCNKTHDELEFPLSKIPMFAEWSQEKITQLRNCLNPEFHAYGSTLIREGAPVFHIVFLLAGDALILRKVMTPERQSSFRSFSSQRKIPQNSANDGGSDLQEMSEVKIATSTRGAVFGCCAALLGTNSPETVRVDSRAGAMVWRLNVADLHLYIDQPELARIHQMMREQSTADDGWSESQAMRQAETIAAVEDEQTKQPTYIAFPSRSELNAITLKLREELMRPLNWNRRKMLRPSSATPSRADSYSRFNRSQTIKRGQRPQSALGRLNGTSGLSDDEKGPNPLYGPSDYLGVGKMLTGKMAVGARELESGPVGLLGTLCHDGVQERRHDVTRRPLFLSSWEMPGDHRVYMGSKVGSLVKSGKHVPHVQMDVDGITCLDAYLPSY